MSNPEPDLKPAQPELAPGSELCGGCQGIAAKTPQSPENRDGLAAIRYRIGEYGDFRSSLQAALSSSEFQQLGGLRTRDSADFTIGLIDAFACAADVLTFYQERIANESYLRTAVERTSLQELGKLIGYRLRPGVAAETWLAFNLETPPQAPPSSSAEPGSFITGIPPKLALEAGLKVQSVPGPGEQPQLFETVEALAEARPTWNALRPWLTDAQPLLPGATFTYLAGVRNNLKVGDALLFLGDAVVDDTGAEHVGGLEWSGAALAADFAASPASSSVPPVTLGKRRFNLRLLTSVEPQPDQGRTLVRWQAGLSALLRPREVHVLRKRAAVFGHNAPDWNSLSLEFRHQYLRNTGDVGTEWPTSRFQLANVDPTSDGGFVDLDVSLPDVQAGSFVVLSRGPIGQLVAAVGTEAQLFDVVSATEVSRADFGLAGKVTRLQLRGGGYARFSHFVRETTVFAASERLTLAEHPLAEPISGDRLPVALSAEGLLPGRRLIVCGTTADGAAVAQQVVLDAVVPIDAKRCVLQVTPALEHALLRDSVVVYANVALASHGETVSQILGAGNAAVPFQRFALGQAPLTYRAAANELGAKSELTVRVGNVAWGERPTLFDAKPGERVFALSTDVQGGVSVVFGDGLRGSRLPSGVNNVVAKYRKGLGAAGNVARGKLTQLLSRPLGLKGVENPLPAQGGTDPEPAEAARASVPLTARTLGRVVSLLDYQDFARAFSGIAKAEAQVLQLPAGNTIAITIAAPDGSRLTPASPVWQHLLAALRRSGDPHVAVQLLAYEARTFELGLRLKLDPAYEQPRVFAAVEAAVRRHFGFDARALGQPVQQSDVVAEVHRVAGVLGADVTMLELTSAAPAPAAASPKVRLLAARTRVEAGVARPSQLLTLALSPLRCLEEMR